MQEFYLAFLYFFLYSVVGWLCEVGYCSIPAGHFINRGFLHGPYCPIYGFGALIVIYLLLPFQGHFWLIFLCGMVSTSLLEYLTHYLMEKLFHAKWWDYSDRKFNLNGRVCLLNSVLFGLLSLVLMYLLHPFASKLISRISETAAPLIAMILLVIMAVDITSSTHVAMELKARLKRLQELGEELGEKLEKQQQEKREAWQCKKEQLERQYEELAAKNNLLARRLLNAFPELKSTEFNEHIRRIQLAVEQRKISRRQLRFKLKARKKELKTQFKATVAQGGNKRLLKAQLKGELKKAGAARQAKK